MDTGRSFGVHAGGAPKYCSRSFWPSLRSKDLPGTYIGEGFEEIQSQHQCCSPRRSNWSLIALHQSWLFLAKYLSAASLTCFFFFPSPIEIIFSITWCPRH